jgi:hypothetical protein
MAGIADGAINLALTIGSAKSAQRRRSRGGEAGSYGEFQPFDLFDAADPMQWHQERQRLLAENVANADTPQFRPRELSPPKFDARPIRGVALVRTSTAHMGSSAASDPISARSSRRIRSQTDRQRREPGRR